MMIPITNSNRRLMSGARKAFTIDEIMAYSPFAGLESLAASSIGAGSATSGSAESGSEAGSMPGNSRTWAVPPAASILDAALLLNASATTKRGRVTSPCPSTLSGLLSDRTMPAAARMSGVMVPTDCAVAGVPSASGTSRIPASGNSSTSTRNRTCRTIPLVASLSGTSTVSPMPCRPRALIVPRLRAMWLIVLLVWVTRSLPGIAHLRGRLTRDPGVDPHASPSAQFLGRVQAPQGLDGGPGDVHGVRGTEDLGQDVADTGRFDDGADGAAGNDAGTLRGRLQHEAGRPELGPDFVRDRGPDHWDQDEVLLGVLDA